MMMVRACVLFALTLPTALPGLSAAASASEPPDLDAILEHLARVAGLYVDEALRFTCDENILSTRYDFNHRPLARQEHDFAYVYVFEETAATARNRLAGLRDFRTELSEAGVTGETTEVDLADLGLALFLRRAYSWAFIFRKETASRYEFRLAGEDRVLERDAVVVAFEAQPPFRVGANDWLGKAWVDAESYQLLRVEAMTPADAEAKALADEARARKDSTGRAYSFATISTDFGVVKNGMRFPSMVTLLGNWVGWNQDARLWGGSYQEHMVYRSEQTYSDYRFFSTRTVDEIRARVLDGREDGQGDADPD